MIDLDKIKNIFRFKIRPKEFLGIDIGSSFIRLSEIGRKGNIFQLRNYGEVGLASFDSKDKGFRTFKANTLSFSDEQIAKAVKAIIKEAGIETKDVSFSIPDFSSFFTRVKLPVMSKNEISQAVKYQVRPYIPLPLEDVTLDWTIVEGRPGETDLKILVVAIPNNVIHHYREIARLCSLNLKFLEPEVFALARSSGNNNKEKKIIGLIDIGARSTTCSVLDRGILKISHSFNVAGNELTLVIARSLNIDYNKAEDIKKKCGMLPSDQSGSTCNVRETLTPLVGSILEEIKKAFRGFYLQEGREIEEIVLAGGLSLMPGLKEFFAVELKKNVTIIDPFLNIASPPILGEVLKEIGPHYGVAIGLALKGLE